ncbi:MAG: hypothetical protein A2289_24600 [Deltaproteobacteria bacterium RIFOXYA12_FULL_58_15]|nr:MAG: hypothetical protein A2289_24600 [Deltaproteobacteria bacterium RIFOXYA12_FULL_58_15]OGR12711.1 MAG: hypothetical protein A2341_07820 [Deltaproteobacteria bacterium RIFOXYB12_FULL_58_9]
MTMRTKHRILTFASMVVAALAYSCAFVSPQTDDFYHTQPSPRSCSCLLVLPFANLSSVSSAGEDVADLFSAHLDAHPSFHSFDRTYISALLRRLNVPPPTEWHPEIGLRIARLAGAEGVLFGTIQGAWETVPGKPASLWIAGTVLSAASGEVLWIGTRSVKPEYVSQSADLAIKHAANAMAEHLVLDLRPTRSTALGACLNPEARLTLSETITASDKPTANLPGEDRHSPQGEPASGILVGGGHEPMGQATPTARTELEKGPSTTTTTTLLSKTNSPMSEAAQLMLQRLEKGEAIPLAVRLTNRSANVSVFPSSELHVFSELLQAKASLRLEVRGHTDSSGDSDDDLRVTKEQATAAAQSLAKLWRVEPDRLVAVAMGSSHPIQPNITKRGRQANRRIEVALVSPTSD